MRLHVGARGAPAFAVFLRHLVGAHALLLGAVEIRVVREPRLARRLDEYSLERVVRAQRRDMERPAAAVVFAAQGLVVLGALEVRQHVGVGPAGVAERGPAVVVAAVAADVDHGVDGARAAERAPARLVAAPPAQSGLRHGLEGPVVDRRRHHEHHRRGRIHHPGIAAAARLQQADAHRGILRQPAGEHAAGGAAARDHIVEVIQASSRPSSAR